MFNKLALAVSCLLLVLVTQAHVLSAAAAPGPKYLTARLCDDAADFSVSAGTRNVEIMCVIVGNPAPQPIYSGQLSAVNCANENGDGDCADEGEVWGNDAAIVMGRSYSTLWPPAGENLQVFSFIDGIAELYTQANLRPHAETTMRFVVDIARLESGDVVAGDFIQMNLVCDAEHYCLVDVRDSTDRFEGGDISLFLAGPKVTITE